MTASAHSRPPVTAYHRGGSGTPLVLLHGLTGSWRIWRPVLPALEAEHEVYALTLPGHLGGSLLEYDRPVSVTALANGVERLLNEHGIRTAHIAGNSLGGWLALELGRRGRARSVIALSPAGGWTTRRDLRRVVRLIASGNAVIRHHERLRLAHRLRRPRLRRLAFLSTMERGDRVPLAELEVLLEASAHCEALEGFLSWVRTAKPIASAANAADYPVRIAWAERDKTIPLARYGWPVLDAIAEAEHVTVPGVGHVPMYDDPDLIARTILEVTRQADNQRSSPMGTSTDIRLGLPQGNVMVRCWNPDDPQRIVVIVHGYAEHSGRYEHVAERLAADGAVVYAPDHRGHGRSDGESALVTDIERLVDDVTGVIRVAREHDPGLPITVLGHSMGGLIAARLAQRGDQELAALVLSSPAIGGHPDIEGLLMLDPIPDVPLDPAALSRDPAVGEAYANDPLVYHGPFKRETLEAIFAGGRAVAEGPSLGSLPTLWIHGENDPLALYPQTREVIERIRGDQFEERIYPEAMHELLNELNRDEVIDEVAAFVDNVTRQRAVA